MSGQNEEVVVVELEHSAEEIDAAIDDINTAKPQIEQALDDIDDLFSNMAPDYPDGGPYEAGDYCIHEGAFYRAKEAVVQGASWDESKWTLISIGEDLAKKANRDDYCPDMTVGASEQIVSSRQIDDPEQSCPPAINGIGTTGGEAEIQTGRNTFEYMEGNSVKYNQLAKKINDQNWTANQTTVSYSSDTIQITIGLATDYYVGFYSTENRNIFYSQHKYLISYDYNVNKTISGFGLRIYNGTQYIIEDTSSVSSTEGKFISRVAISTASENGSTANNLFFFSGNGWSQGDSYKVRNIVIIDLTALEIDTTDTDEAIAILKSRGIDVNGYLPYNTGTILDAQTSEMVSTRFNQWDEEYLPNKYLSESGEVLSHNGSLTAKNYTKVLPSTTYYIKSPATGIRINFHDENLSVIGTQVSGTSTTFVTPVNCAYIRFSVFNYESETYHNDINVNLCEWGGVVDTGRNGEYEKADFQKVTLPNIPLRSVPNYADPENPIRDIAYSVGGGKRKVKRINMSELNWYYSSSNYRIAAVIPSDMQYPATVNDIPNIRMSSYVPGPATTSLSDHHDVACIIEYNSVRQLIMYSNNGQTPDGVLEYELIAEEDIPVSENPGWTESVYTDNYGTIQFHTDPQQSPQVPQPYFIKYTINLVDFTDTAYVKTKGDANNIVTYGDLEEKGYVVPKANEAGIADQLLSNKAVTDQIPFLFRGMPNGVGNRAYDKLVGFNVNWNSILTNGDFSNGYTNWDVYSGTGSIANGVLTVTGATGRDGVRHDRNKDTYANHKYFYSFTYTATVECNVSLFASLTAYIPMPITSSFVTKNGIVNSSVDSKVNFDFFPSVAGTTGDFSLKNVMFIDLTQLFGPTIADYLYGLPNNGGITLFRQLFPKPFYPFCESKILSVKASGKKYQGVNQWDEEWETGYWDTGDGTAKSSSSFSRSKNAIEVSANTQYCLYHDNGGSGYVLFYDGNGGYLGSYYEITTMVATTFTTPAGCRYIKFYLSNISFSGKICINISDPAINGTYYPHEEWNVSLDENVELNGVLKLDAGNNLYADGDVWESGKVTRNARVLTFTNAENTWGKLEYEGKQYFYCTPSNAKFYFEGVCSKYPRGAANGLGSLEDKSWTSFGGAGYAIWIRDSAYDSATTIEFGAAMAGETLYYEVDESTEETAPSFVNPSPCNPYGTENYLVPTDEDTGVELPVGHETTYPQNLQKKLDDMPNLPTANGQYVLDINGANATYTDLTSWLTANGYNKMQDLSSEITDLAGLAYDFKKAYRIGNMVFVTIRAKNATGNSIPAGTALFSFGTHITPGLALYASASIGGSAIVPANIWIGEGRGIELGAALSNDGYVTFMFSYAVS